MLLSSLLSFHLWRCTEFCGSHAQPQPINNNQGFCNMWSKAPRSLGDVVAGIFLIPNLDSPASVAVLLPDVESFISHPIDPGQHYFLQAFRISLHVESKTTWGEVWKHDVTISGDYLIYHAGVRVFHHYRYKLTERATQQLLFKFNISSWSKNFSNAKNQNMFG